MMILTCSTEAAASSALCGLSPRRRGSAQVPSDTGDRFHLAPATTGLAWIREAEADVAGGAFGQRRGEHTCGHVAVVVDLDDLLSGVWSQDPSDELHEPAVKRDRSGE